MLIFGLPLALLCLGVTASEIEQDRYVKKGKLKPKKICSKCQDDDAKLVFQLRH